MTQNWTITGDYVEACNCDVACQCLWGATPDEDRCIFSSVFHITDGQYGDVDLSGLHAALLGRCEEGVMIDPDTAWHVVLLIDESADDGQRAALEAIYLGRAGGVFAAAADAHFESTEVTTAPFSFARNEAEFSVEIGDSVSLAVVGNHGFNDELGTMTPHPFTKDTEMKSGRSTTATVSYNDEFSWDVSENNSFFTDFELASA